MIQSGIPDECVLVETNPFSSTLFLKVIKVPYEHSHSAHIQSFDTKLESSVTKHICLNLLQYFHPNLDLKHHVALDEERYRHSRNIIILYDGIAMDN